MPSYKGQDGYKDIFHAITKEAREQMNDAIMKAYEQKLVEQMDQSQDREQGEALPGNEPAEQTDAAEETEMQGMSQQG